MEASRRASGRARRPVVKEDVYPATHREEKLLRLAIDKSREDTRAPTEFKPQPGLILYPTFAEFDQPVKYLSDQRRAISLAGGIAKIIPPEGWDCPFSLNTKNLIFPTKSQVINTLGEGLPYGDGENYDVDSYKVMAEKFRGEWERRLEERGLDVGNTETWKDAYWKIVEGGEANTVMVEYGNDVPTEDIGGGFPKKTIKLSSPASSSSKSSNGGGSPNGLIDATIPNFQDRSYYANTEWNPEAVAFARGSVLSGLRDKLNGINVPWIYFGMTFATFSWHVEDNWFYSLNYHHMGHGKVWYGVSPDQYNLFNKVMRENMPQRFDEAPDIMSHITTMLSPSWLMSRGVRVCSVVQLPGEFVVTLPAAYHGGFSLGFNCGEAVNFASVDWLTSGRICRNVYRSQRREPVIAHDKIVWSLGSRVANGELQLNRDQLSLLLNELTLLRTEESTLRDKVKREGVTFSVKMPPEDLSSDEPDIRRPCFHCKQPCSLSAVICQCKPDLAACPTHQGGLCFCNSNKRCLVYWFSMEEFDKIITGLSTQLRLTLE